MAATKDSTGEKIESEPKKTASSKMAANVCKSAAEQLAEAGSSDKVEIVATYGNALTCLEEL